MRLGRSRCSGRLNDKLYPKRGASPRFGGLACAVRRAEDDDLAHVHFQLADALRRGARQVLELVVPLVRHQCLVAPRAHHHRAVPAVAARERDPAAARVGVLHLRVGAVLVPREPRQARFVHRLHVGLVPHHVGIGSDARAGDRREHGRAAELGGRVTGAMQARQLRSEAVPARFLAARSLCPALGPRLRDRRPHRSQLRLAEGGGGDEVPLLVEGAALFGADGEARHGAQRLADAGRLRPRGSAIRSEPGYAPRATARSGGRARPSRLR